MKSHDGWTPVEIKNGKRHASCSDRSGRFCQGFYCIADNRCALQAGWDEHPDTEIATCRDEVQTLKEQLAVLKSLLDAKEKVLNEKLSHQEFLRQQEVGCCKYKRLYYLDYPQHPLSPDWHAYELDNWHR